MKGHPTREDLWDLASGGSSPREASRLGRHLAVCAACRVALADEALLVSKIRRLPPLAPSAGFEAGALARLGMELETLRAAPLPSRVPRRLGWTGRLREFVLLRPAWTLAGATAVALLALAILRPRPPERIDLALVSQLDLLEHFDEISNLEVLEGLDRSGLVGQGG